MKVKYLGETHPLSLTHGQVYEVIAITDFGNWYRIIDNRGIREEYEPQGALYEPNQFEVVEYSEVPEEEVINPAWMMKCQLCGNPVEIHDICEVCGWEWDVVLEHTSDRENYSGGANHMSLNEAREAFRKGEKIH